MRFTPILLALWLCLWTAAAPAAPPPLTVVLLPDTTLTDWRNADAPTLHQLMASGALAVQNTRTARTVSDQVRETPGSALLTLGAGSRASGGDVHCTSQWAVVPGVGGTAGELYTRRMGVRPPIDALVCVDWPRVLHDNAGRGYDIAPGNLGDALSRANVTVNAQGRFARLLLTSGAGTVTNSAAPTLCVIDSDLLHAEPLLHRLALSVKASGGQLLVLSPFVGDAAYQGGERFAPVLVWGRGVPAGVLVSPSTRRPGLVLNTDFAPSVAAHFGATLPMPAFGRAWTVKADADNILSVSQLETGAYRQAALMRLLPFCALALGASVLLGMVTRRRALALVPPVLALTLAVSTSVYAFVLWLAAFGLGATLGRRRVGTARTVAWACALLSLVLAFDMMTGNTLMRTGMLGYSAVEGARFYGIGNEAMGALVGAVLIVAARAWGRGGRPSRLLTACALAGVVLLLGTAGAKAGGVLVGGGAFAVLLWTLTGRRVTGRLLLTVTLGAGILLLTFAGMDTLQGGHSHFGQALGRISTGGPSEAWDIVSRKASVEGRLLWHSAWAVPLWLSVLTLVRRPASPLRAAGVTAVALCLLANDAGVVAGALCGTLVWAGLTTQKQAAVPLRERRPVSSA